MLSDVVRRGMKSSIGLQSEKSVERRAASEAMRAAARAYAPFSEFRVGAVLEDTKGCLQAGCNIECTSIGLTLCAERVALGLALARGAKGFLRIWIYTPTQRPTPPCGACRELLSRVADDMTVVLLCDGQPPKRMRWKSLVPRREEFRRGSL